MWCLSWNQDAVLEIGVHTLCFFQLEHKTTKSFSSSLSALGQEIYCIPSVSLLFGNYIYFKFQCSQTVLCLMAQRSLLNITWDYKISVRKPISKLWKSVSEYLSLDAVCCRLKFFFPFFCYTFFFFLLLGFAGKRGDQETWEAEKFWHFEVKLKRHFLAGSTFHAWQSVA